jgi:hypothetical protein
MSDASVQVPQLSESIAEMYSIRGKLCESVNFTVHSAVLDSERESRIVVVGKIPLDLLGDGVRRFGAQLSALLELFSHQENKGALLLGGLDSQRYPFLELASVSGSQYSEGARALPEAERRFQLLVDEVAKFHAAGICFGDLSFASFMDDPANGPFLVGLLGLINPYNSIGVRSSEEVFLAPEILKGQIPSPASDVFSLCIIGAFLFGLSVTHELRFDAPQLYGKLVRKGVSDWLSRVISCGVTEEPGSRPNSSVELAELLREARQGRLSGPLIKLETEPITGAGENPNSASGSQVFGSPQIKQDISPHSRLGKTVLTIALLGILVALVAFYLRGISPNQDAGVLGQSTAFLRSVGFSLTMTSAERAQMFERLAQSTDPAVHDAAILLIERASTVKERVAAENWLLDRCARAGMMRSVKIIKAWFGDKPLVRPQGFIAGLRVLDPSAPSEVLDRYLDEIVMANRPVAIQIAAGLLLDNVGHQGDRKSLSRLVASAFDEKDLLSRPIPAVLIAIPETRNEFELDLKDSLSSLSTSDLEWLISVMVKQGDYLLLSRIANALATTPDITDLQRSMLRSVVSDESAPIAIRGAVARLAFGTFSNEDVGLLARWNDVRAGALLLNLSQFQLEEDRLREVFNALIIKKIASEPAAAMVTALGKIPEGDRLRLGRAIGYFYSITENGKVPEAPDINLVTAAAEDSSILSAIMKSECSPCREIVIDIVPQKLSSAMLFSLLKAGEPNLRIKALRRLAQYHDIGAINLLRKSYSEEKDSQVREVYENLLCTQQNLSGSNSLKKIEDGQPGRSCLE